MESIMSVIPAVACPSPLTHSKRAQEHKSGFILAKAQIRIFIGQNLPTGHRYRLNSLSHPAF